MAISIGSLDHFVLQGVQPTEHQLGAGAYGRVFEVEYAGTTCAAKEIHPIFFRVARQAELDRIKRNFLHECQIWSTLRHPNIVQFIGIHYPMNDDNGLPVMVMEKMQCSLLSFVEGSEGADIQLLMKLSILHDVSMGLWYLHIRNPPVVHHDLTPNNILLGKHFEAKITDLGVAKVIRDTDSGRQMTKAPGTPHFMPPEALDDNPAYGPSLDIFSYGAVILYVITQDWPEPRAREKYNLVTGKRELVSEVERRQEYLDKITESEVGIELRRLVVSCLDDDPAMRPVIADISRSIKRLKVQYSNRDETGDFSIPTTSNLLTHKPISIEVKEMTDQRFITSPHQSTKEIRKIKWRDGVSAPVKLVPYSTLYHNGLVYVGGHGAKVDTAYRIYIFDPVNNLWHSSSIITPYCSFGMTTLHNKLITVGGTTRGKWFTHLKSTNKVLVLDETTNRWKDYTQMSTARSGASVVGHKEMLIVTGGWCCHNSIILSSTEVLDSSTNQWFSCADLPQPHVFLQSAVVDNSLYLLGGANQDGASPLVFAASLDTLSQHKLNWRAMQETTWCFSSVVSVHNQLLVIGGRRSKMDVLHTSNIYKLNKVTGAWEVISQLPQARGAVSAVTVSDDTIVIIGGTKMEQKKRKRKLTKTVWIGTVE